MQKRDKFEPPVFVTGDPRRQYNEQFETRQALGAAIHWFPAYNDGVAGEVPMLLLAPGCCSLLLVCSYAACCSRLLAVDIALPLYSR